ncbi:MAG: YceI family protein [Candidatus Dadabacteria bacterium]|nr:MAG: YceI family protein [Candidatus Dadabacteria bacterium]
MKQMCLMILTVAVAAVSPARAAEVEWEPADSAHVTWYLHHPLHEVTSVAGDIRFLKPLRMDVAALPDALTTITELPVQIPWKAFDSGNRNRDANMLLAVKADAFPLATYVLERAEVTATVADRHWQGTFAGRLYLAGQKQPVTATFDLQAQQPDAPRLRARFSVDMRQFGIDPPRLLMFAADPVVQVRVDLPLRPGR